MWQQPGGSTVVNIPLALKISILQYTNFKVLTGMSRGFSGL